MTRCPRRRRAARRRSTRPRASSTALGSRLAAHRRVRVLRGFLPRRGCRGAPWTARCVITGRSTRARSGWAARDGCWRSPLRPSSTASPSRCDLVCWGGLRSSPPLHPGARTCGGVHRGGRAQDGLTGSVAASITPRLRELAARPSAARTTAMRPASLGRRSSGSAGAKRPQHAGEHRRRGASRRNGLALYPEQLGAHRRRARASRALIEGSMPRKQPASAISSSITEKDGAAAITPVVQRRAQASATPTGS